MTRIVKALGVILICQLAMGLLLAEEEPTDQEKKQLAVKLARLLEAEPFHKDAKEARRWLTVWMIEVPDVTVHLCGNFLGPVFEKDEKYSSELVVQMGYSQAAFIIENPDKAENLFECYRAGLLGSLRMYESILAAKPKASLKYMDELLRKRESGELDDYVRLKMKGCDG